MYLVPGPPRNIKALSVDSSQILVSWLPPSQANGNILSYTVHCKTMMGGQQKVDKMEITGTSSVVVPSLVLHQPYSFWVTARTVMGEGARWEVIIMMGMDKMIIMMIVIILGLT